MAFKDGRFNSTYSTDQVILHIFFVFLLRKKNFDELNLMIINYEFIKLFFYGTKEPQVDVIIDTLKTN